MTCIDARVPRPMVQITLLHSPFKLDCALLLLFSEKTQSFELLIPIMIDLSVSSWSICLCCPGSLCSVCMKARATLLRNLLLFSVIIIIYVIVGSELLNTTDLSIYYSAIYTFTGDKH